MLYLLRTRARVRTKLVRSRYRDCSEEEHLSPATRFVRDLHLLRLPHNIIVWDNSHKTASNKRDDCPTRSTWFCAILRCPKAATRASLSSYLTAGKSFVVTSGRGLKSNISRYGRPQKRRYGTPAETQNPATSQRTHSPGTVTNARVTLRTALPRFAPERIRPNSRHRPPLDSNQ